MTSHFEWPIFWMAFSLTSLFICVLKLCWREKELRKICEEHTRLFTHQITVLTNVTERQTRAADAFKSGIISVNELRQSFGLPPLERDRRLDEKEVEAVEAAWPDLFNPNAKRKISVAQPSEQKDENSL